MKKTFGVWKRSGTVVVGINRGPEAGPGTGLRVYFPSAGSLRLLERVLGHRVRRVQLRLKPQEMEIYGTYEPKEGNGPS